MTITSLDVSNTSTVTFLQHAQKTNEIITEVNSANTNVTAALATKAANTYVNSELATKAANSYVNSQLSLKANTTHPHTFSELLSKPTTLSGYSISSLDLGTNPTTFSANTSVLRIKSGTGNTVITSTSTILSDATRTNTITPSSTLIGNTTVKTYQDSTKYTVIAPTSNTAISSTGLTISNTTVSFSLVKPTAAQVTAGNYFPGSNGVWQQVQTANTTNVLTGTSTTTYATPDSIAALWEKGTDVASAGTLTLGEGEYFHVTGTTTITDIDFATAKDGRKAILVFDGALTLTHNATTLILPGAANITTAAGDTCMVVQDNSDNVKVVWYQKANGTSVTSSSEVVLLGTLTTTSGTTQDLLFTASVYRALYIEIEGVSFGAVNYLGISLTSNGGTSYSSSLAQVSAAPGGHADAAYGHVMVYGISQNLTTFGTNTVTATCVPAVYLPTTIYSTPSKAWIATTAGPANGIRFAGGSGGTFDAGTIRVYGILKN